MHYVYILQSQTDPKKLYVGSTSNLRQRLLDHNEGKQRYTAPSHPWTLIWYGAFPSKSKALAFEKYLKSGSGHAFRNRHLQ
jgi:putative endonuclease